MQNIFLVILSAGSYDDAYTRNLRAFGEKEVAERFATDERDRLLRQQGVMQARDTMLGAWDKTHPYPEHGQDDSDCRRAEVASYYALRNAECERLNQLLGLTEKAIRDSEDVFSIRVEEVAFGERALVVD
jgi:hypothetical protein